MHIKFVPLCVLHTKEQIQVKLGSDPKRGIGGSEVVGFIKTVCSGKALGT